MGARAESLPSGFRIGGEGERLTMLDPAALAARFPEIPRGGAGDTPRFEAYAIEVADLSATRALLESRGIAFRAAADTLVLPPTAAFGVAIELRTPA